MKIIIKKQSFLRRHGYSKKSLLEQLSEAEIRRDPQSKKIRLKTFLLKIRTPIKISYLAFNH